MKHLSAAILGITTLCLSPVASDAGCLNFHKSRHCDDCHVAVPMDPCCGAPATAYGAMALGFGGVAQVGTVYGMHMAHSGGFTGYEGLPVMSDGGLHGRYPYHSYRRPWAHPGPRSTNVNIIW